MKRTPEPEVVVPKEVTMDFEELYALHCDRVRFICYRMMGTDHSVEDVVQEVFLQVFKKRHQFRGTSTFTTWLHRLTVNQVQQHWRRPAWTNRWRHPSLYDLRYSYLIAHPHMVLRVAINRAIERLPPGMRQIFTLHDIEGLEHPEIAKLLGCKEGTSKSQLHKARAKLQAALS